MNPPSTRGLFIQLQVVYAHDQMWNVDEDLGHVGQIFCKPIKRQRFSRYQTSKFRVRGRSIDVGYRIDLNDIGIQRTMPKELSWNKDRSLNDDFRGMRELNSPTLLLLELSGEVQTHGDV